MGITTKRARKAEKARKRKQRVKLRDAARRRANHRAQCAADLLVWVLEGPELDVRPAVHSAPPPPNAGIEWGRWVARRHLRIGDLLHGDEKYAYAVTALPADPKLPPSLQRLQKCKVERTFANGRKKVLRVHFANETVRVTPNHPWYVKDQGWTPSALLRPGDLLMKSNGGFVPVEKVEDLDEETEVYNLSIADCRTYFIGAADAGPSVLVHNQSPGRMDGRPRRGFMSPLAEMQWNEAHRKPDPPVPSKLNTDDWSQDAKMLNGATDSYLYHRERVAVEYREFLSMHAGGASEKELTVQAGVIYGHLYSMVEWANSANRWVAIIQRSQGTFGYKTGENQAIRMWHSTGSVPHIPGMDISEKRRSTAAFTQLVTEAGAHADAEYGDVIQTMETADEVITGVQLATGVGAVVTVGVKKIAAKEGAKSLAIFAGSVTAGIGIGLAADQGVQYGGQLLGYSPEQVQAASKFLQHLTAAVGASQLIRYAQNYGKNGTLTAGERLEIQGIANKYNTTIDVVGSRAYGQGRNINGNLPTGKGRGTRSDIDFRIDTTHPEVESLMSALRGVGNGAGRASLKHGTGLGAGHRPSYPPYIRFSPFQ